MERRVAMREKREMKKPVAKGAAAVGVGLAGGAAEEWRWRSEVR